MYVFGGRSENTVFSDLYALDFSKAALRWRCIGASIRPFFVCLQDLS